MGAPDLVTGAGPVSRRTLIGEKNLRLLGEGGVRAICEILPARVATIGWQTAATPTCRVDPPDSQVHPRIHASIQWLHRSSQPQTPAMEARLGELRSGNWGVSQFSRASASASTSRAVSHTSFLPALCPIPPITPAGSGSRHFHCHCQLLKPDLRSTYQSPAFVHVSGPCGHSRFSLDSAQIFSPAILPSIYNFSLLADSAISCLANLILQPGRFQTILPPRPREINLPQTSQALLSLSSTLICVVQSNHIDQRGLPR